MVIIIRSTISGSLDENRMATGQERSSVGKGIVKVTLGEATRARKGLARDDWRKEKLTQYRGHG